MTRNNRSERARLIRWVPTRLLDVSLSGCLIETEREVGVGTPGTLHIRLWGVECRYPVRVTRVVPESTPGRVWLAAEFAWGAEAKTMPNRPVLAVPKPRTQAARVLTFERVGTRRRP